MKTKKALVRSVVIIVILLLSILTATIFQSVFDSIERSNYPRQYKEFVEKYAYEYGVPEYVIYSVIKVESGFDSGAVSDAGAVGLMQMMPDTFTWLTSLRTENLDSAMLYDPETNIDYGVYYLHKLFVKYNSWPEVYAAYNAGESNVDKWLLDENCTDEDGKLTDIPFDETSNYVNKVKKANEIYKKLYYQD